MYKHQKAAERIAQMIRASDGSSKCSCVHVMDTYVQFPNGLKRPDISIFCREPTEEEQENALTLIPETVVEVVNKGYEVEGSGDRSAVLSVARSQGRAGFDPSTLLVLHVRHGGAERMISPVDIVLQCGCVVTI